MVATFNDLVAEADGASVLDAVETAQEGTSWEFYAPVMECLDDAGNYTEVSLTGCTAEWKVLDKVDGSVLVTLSTSIVGNQVKGTATPASTSGLGGTGKLGRRCPWYCTVTNGAGRKVSIFGPQDSLLVITQGA